MPSSSPAKAAGCKPPSQSYRVGGGEPRLRFARYAALDSPPPTRSAAVTRHARCPPWRTPTHTLRRRACGRQERSDLDTENGWRWTPERPELIIEVGRSGHPDGVRDSRTGRV